MAASHLTSSHQTTLLVRGTTVVKVGKYSNARVDRAAGGVVAAVVSGVVVVAVVHRPRHDDWTLPKGHVDRGETWEQAARREVLEETGLVAGIVGQPSVIGYMIDDVTPKIVVFYPMSLRAGSGTHDDIGHDVDASEVDAVAWWSIERAALELTYLDERQVLDELTP